MNCLIVDDSDISREILKKMVALDQELNLVAECKDATEAYNKIIEYQIDLLLLDIEMPEMTGIELVRSLGQKQPLIIFTTSRSDYAAEAFDLAVVDFITKPVTAVRFLQAIERAKEFRVKPQNLNIKNDGFIFIRDSTVIRNIKLLDILFFEAQGDYVRIYVGDKSYTIYSTLKAVEDKFTDNIFFRVHRSFIVNISKIDTLENGLITINGNKIPVSDAYRGPLNKRIQVF